jgi:hypothetical protein
MTHIDNFVDLTAGILAGFSDEIVSQLQCSQMSYNALFIDF